MIINLISLGVVVIFSAALSILVWYNRRLVGQWTAMVDDVKYLQERTEEFKEHLNVVLAMESYSGEAVIENLLKHAKAYSTELGEFKTTYVFDPDFASSVDISEGELMNEKEEE